MDGQTPATDLFMIWCGGMYFTLFHDATGTGKSADALASEWIAGIQMNGPDVSNGFVADGEASNSAASDIVQNAYKHFTVS